MVTSIDVSEEAAASVHDHWSGKTTALDAVIARSRSARAGGVVEWYVPVTPRTVYALQGLHALARDEGVQLRWASAQGLGERERAFIDDFLAYGPETDAARARLMRRIAEVARAAIETADALRNALTPARGVPRTDAALASAVIIGAYGGDHVGDAAALGRILLTLHERHGLQRAWVMSHRPMHTRRLVAGLDVPVEVRVEDYRPGRAARLLDGADALVVGGGPMMDLPRVLAKHLATAHAARVRGLPLLIERVGLGPFRRPVSRWAVRRLACMAKHISVRSSADARDPRLAGRSVEVARDGAFEYLQRHTHLHGTGPAVASLDRLLAGTAGRRLVAINLRPIRHIWSARGAAYSMAAQDRFMDDFAKALVAFAEESERPVTYVFYPMNAVQFGMSDLGSAVRLHRILKSAVDLRVWETDPDVDDVLHLLRRVDLAVAMRYHAAIFALAQGVPVLGIDYYPGAGGKDEHLFADLGRRDDVCRMDEFTVAWFVAGARRLLSRHS